VEKITVVPPLAEPAQLEHPLSAVARVLVPLQSREQQQVLLHAEPPV
jgi:hypothetical protein